MSWKYDDDNDDEVEEEEARISENSYFWMSLQNTPLVTVQEDFCTLLHTSQQVVQAARTAYSSAL